MACYRVNLLSLTRVRAFAEELVTCLFIKKVRFVETSAKLETYKNATKIDGAICVRIY